ncbi:hypothetical protein [Methanobrevibacter curvatus]|uniref:Uncharacterized protein n=1 Tax=Methanobrevibacter curvatus TaxID=49547 RepID=A0A166AV99_9EURY|nr:hypothetical protein [Methanobrevibacter curvatus]KZX12512.1 hypothetical protein MBCUR_10490 [Methanobrevibacter curvatus]
MSNKKEIIFNNQKFKITEETLFKKEFREILIKLNKKIENDEVYEKFLIKSIKIFYNEEKISNNRNKDFNFSKKEVEDEMDFIGKKLEKERKILMANGKTEEEAIEVQLNRICSENLRMS